MLLLHMQEIVFVDSQEGLLSSRGGGGGAQTYWHQAYIIIYNNIIIKHIKQKGMIKNKTCQLEKG